MHTPVSISFFRFASLTARIWALTMMGAAACPCRVADSGSGNLRLGHGRGFHADSEHGRLCHFLAPGGRRKQAPPTDSAGPQSSNADQGKKRLN